MLDWIGMDHFIDFIDKLLDYRQERNPPLTILTNKTAKMLFSLHNRLLLHKKCMVISLLFTLWAFWHYLSFYDIFLWEKSSMKRWILQKVCKMTSHRNNTIMEAIIAMVAMKYTRPANRVRHLCMQKLVDLLCGLGHCYLIWVFLEYEFAKDEEHKHAKSKKAPLCEGPNYKMGTLLKGYFCYRKHTIS